MGRSALIPRVVPLPSSRGRGRLLVERNAMVYRHDWLVLASGFFEPLFYLLSLGIGIARLVPAFEIDGIQIGYTAFVAPAMLAAAAMNGAVADTTYNMFFKMKYAKLYDVVLATPMRPFDIALGEICWALIRGALYSAAFCVTMLAMGLVMSWWALLVVPAAMLIGFAFAALGMAGTTWMKSWQHFEYIQITVMPMFLFSGTFFPISVYPPAVQLVIQLTPLYHGVELARGLTTGLVSFGMLGNVAYLAAISVVGLLVASRRIGRLLLK